MEDVCQWWEGGVRGHVVSINPYGSLILLALLLLTPPPDVGLDLATKEPAVWI